METDIPHVTQRAEEKDTDLLLSNDGFNIFSLNTLYRKHDAGKCLRERVVMKEYMR